MKFSSLDLKPDNLLFYICQCLGMLSLFILLFYNVEQNCFNCLENKTNIQKQQHLSELLKEQHKLHLKHGYFGTIFLKNKNSFISDNNYIYRIITPMPPVNKIEKIPSIVNLQNQIMIVAESINPNLPSYVGGIFFQFDGKTKTYKQQICQLRQGIRYPEQGLSWEKDKIKCPPNSIVIQN